MGDHVDVSMLGVLTSLVATEDWAALVAPQEKLAVSLFKAMGRADLLDDPRFATRDPRVHHDQALTTEIQRWSMQRSTTDVVASLQQAGFRPLPSGRRRGRPGRASYRSRRDAPGAAPNPGVHRRLTHDWHSLPASSLAD
jgi:CoA-transferase family III